MPQLFVAVATGQNVANLPPLLEFANRGDHVLWIESREAKKNGWSEGARSVLENSFHLTNLSAVEIDDLNDPAQLAERLRARTTTFKKYDHVFTILNGGNKLTPIGLLLGLKDLQPVGLYGEDQPAVFRVFRGSFVNPPEIRPYTRHQLDLPDILAATGHHLGSSSKVIRLWPGTLSHELNAERYGIDVPATIALHLQHSAYRQWKDDEASNQLLEPVAFDELPRFVRSEDLRKWRSTIRQCTKSDPIMPQEYAAAYHATNNLSNTAQRARALKLAGVPIPDMKLGNTFERAIARRTHAWLEATKPTFIQSVWLNAVVFRAVQNVVELDVVFVLKNGILWHLECKSSKEATKKDLDARLLNLQTAGSRLARMAICAPVFANYVQEAWFAPLQAMRETVERSRLPFIPFTLPNQPTSYPWGDQPAVLCPTFEEALEKELKRYA